MASWVQELPMTCPIPFYFQMLLDMTVGTASEKIPIAFFDDRYYHLHFMRAYRHVDFLSVYIAIKGSGVHYVEGVPSEVEAGDVYTMGYGMSHHFAHSDSLVLQAIHFQPEILSAEAKEILTSSLGLVPLFLGNEGGGSARWLRLPPAECALALDMVREMKDEWERNTPDSALMVQAIFLRFLIFLGRCHPRTERVVSRIVRSARARIESEYAEPIKISDLAASSFLSISRFAEIFREEMGCSPREYLGQVRLNAAKRLLKDTSLSITTIAAKTGFVDPAYFARFFRQQVGCTPSQFRVGTGYGG